MRLFDGARLHEGTCGQAPGCCWEPATVRGWVEGEVRPPSPGPNVRNSHEPRSYSGCQGWVQAEEQRARQEAERKQRESEEAAKRKAEEDARKKAAEEEAARQKAAAEEAARRKAAEDEAARKAAADAQAAKQREAQQAAAAEKKKQQQQAAAAKPSAAPAPGGGVDVDSLVSGLKSAAGEACRRCCVYW